MSESRSDGSTLSADAGAKKGIADGATTNDAVNEASANGRMTDDGPNHGITIESIDDGETEQNTAEGAKTDGSVGGETAGRGISRTEETELNSGTDRGKCA